MKPEIGRLGNDFGAGYMIDYVRIGKKRFEVLDPETNMEKAILASYEEGLRDGEIEADRREKVFMEIVGKKSEHAGELQAVNELLEKAEARIKELGDGIKKHKFEKYGGIGEDNRCTFYDVDDFDDEELYKLLNVREKEQKGG